VVAVEVVAYVSCEKVCRVVVPMEVVAYVNCKKVCRVAYADNDVILMVD